MMTWMMDIIIIWTDRIWTNYKMTETLQLVFKDQSGRHHWKMGNPHN